ncbi:MAG: Gfo/Idh/MocA family oxidoreductase [Candidatus Hydrogenedentes bacterium]|nr:Gfo/Idh/MocA family oxidoreductase [Candidatus Hydrogenedentota bacterium]
MAKKKVKVGIIGCGAIAERLHIPDYIDCGRAKIVAFCDVDKKRAQANADQHSPGAAVYTDYKALLKNADVEAVSVCMPNKFHGVVSIAAAKAGKHVLVEKPMAMSLAEAKRMVAAAEKAEVLLMVNQSQRKYPAHIKAKEVLDSDIMGKVLHVTAMFGHEGPEFWSPSGKWFFNKKEARFGVMADLGVHKADLIRFLTGKEIVEINAFYKTVEKKRTDVDDNFVSSFVFDDGSVGTLAASWTAKGGMANYTILHCENGTLEVCLHADKPLVANMMKPGCQINFDMPAPPSNYDGSWGLDIGGSFVRAIMGEEKPFCTGVEGMKSLAVILAAEKAADTRKTVKVTV